MVINTMISTLIRKSPHQSSLAKVPLHACVGEVTRQVLVCQAVVGGERPGDMEQSTVG